MVKKPADAPAAPPTPPVLQVKLSPEHFRLLDDLRKKQPDLPNRSDMIRRLIERAAGGK